MKAREFIERQRRHIKELEDCTTRIEALGSPPELVAELKATADGVIACGKRFADWLDEVKDETTYEALAKLVT